MPIASSLAGASVRGEGQFDLIQATNATAVIYAVSCATAASGTGSAITFQTAGFHYLDTLSSPVTVTIANAPSFNGTFTVATTPTPTSFTVSSTATGSYSISPQGSGYQATVSPMTTWTCPPNVYNISVAAIGAGGGGGNITNTGGSKTPTYVYTSGPAGGNTYFGNSAVVTYFTPNNPSTGIASYVYGYYPGTPTITTGMNVTVTGSSVAGVNIANATVIGTGNDGNGHQTFSVANSSSTPAQYVTATVVDNAIPTGAYITAGGGFGQTATSVSYVQVSGGTYTISPPLGISSGATGGGYGGMGGGGGGGAGGYTGQGGNSHSVFDTAISLTSMAGGATSSIAPPLTNSGSSSYYTNVITASGHGFQVGELIYLTGINQTSTAGPVTSISNTDGANTTVTVTNGASGVYATDSVILYNLVDVTFAGSSASVSTTSGSLNVTYNGFSHNFVVGQFVYMGGVTSLATVTACSATGTTATYYFNVPASATAWTGQLVTIISSPTAQFNITGFVRTVATGAAGNFTILGSSGTFAAQGKVAGSATVYQGYGNTNLMYVSATGATTFTASGNANGAVSITGSASSATRATISLLGAPSAIWPVATQFGISGSATAAGSGSTFVLAAGVIGRTPTGYSAPSSVASATPSYYPTSGVGAVVASSTNTFTWWNGGNNLMKPGTGGTAQRVTSNGTGGGGAAGGDQGALVTGGVGSTGLSGGGTQINGYVGSTLYSGVVGQSQNSGVFEGGSWFLPITAYSSTTATATLEVDPNYPPNKYVNTGEYVNIGNSGPYDGFRQVTGVTATSFSISNGTTAARTVVTASAYPQKSAGQTQPSGPPAISNKQGSYGGNFGGGGMGNVGGGGGGSVAWINSLSVIPNKVYTVMVGIGGSATFTGTASAYYQAYDGGGGHGALRIMYGQTHAFPNGTIV
jgi:hypothetical protein